MSYDTGLDSLGCDASRAGKAQQGMRQVIHKLQLLHRVWQNVLPHSVYIKAISEPHGGAVGKGGKGFGVIMDDRIVHLSSLLPD